jgi:hypothetical protein
MWLQLVYRCLHSLSDGEIVFRHACKLGLDGMVIQTPWLALSLRAITSLGQRARTQNIRQ